MRGCHLACGVVCAVLGRWAAADEILLKNGRTLEGLLVRETDTAIVLDLGAGTVQIHRSQVENVRRSSPEEAARIRAQWRDRYFLQRRYVPPTMQPLADAIRRTLSQRESAVAARAALGAADREERELQNDIAALRHRLASAAARLSETPLGGDIRTYNALVADHNALVAALAGKQEAMDRLRKRQEELRNKLTAYAEALASCERQFAEAAGRIEPAPDADAVAFLEKAAERLRTCAQEFRSTSVATECKDGHAWVRVQVNGRGTGRFMVDTGASVVSLFETMARQAGVTIEGAPSVDIVLGDGTRARAWPVVLDSVQVDGERVEGVPAVVLKGSGREDMDGLLGMSYLRHFMVQFDAGGCRLVLKRFTPP